jgi:choline dehydrogenase-like flavoprotein
MSTTIFTARKIVTMNPANPEVTAVAVRDGMIIAAGTLEECASMRDAALAAGYPWKADLNAPEGEGISCNPINSRNGQRVTTNDGYLEPTRGRPNLHIRGGALVDRVTFDGRTVEYRSLDELGRALSVLYAAENSAARRPSVTLASFSREGTK